MKYFGNDDHWNDPLLCLMGVYCWLL